MLPAMDKLLLPYLLQSDQEELKSNIVYCIFYLLDASIGPGGIEISNVGYRCPVTTCASIGPGGIEIYFAAGHQYPEQLLQSDQEELKCY